MGRLPNENEIDGRRRGRPAKLIDGFAYSAATNDMYVIEREATAFIWARTTVTQSRQVEWEVQR
jgi:hypothetical protein